LLTGAFTGALTVLAFTGVFTAGAPGAETGEPVGDAVSGTAVGTGVHVVLLALQLSVSCPVAYTNIHATYDDDSGVDHHLLSLLPPLLIFLLFTQYIHATPPSSIVNYH
jgi:hypothetical protein